MIGAIALRFLSALTLGTGLVQVESVVHEWPAWAGGAGDGSDGDRGEL
eukprot:CAMPEP_0196739182 /NCGR_PEP_ID=MMETSP1091-20130531/20748_1 /TAXON_ID=302021 /ORGANISM="Rhodomonas sp., Strain CCMP768" /LENGTH=47 /DNA_ID= /DNA_START= /DNA_END= /DNA_ORIENTATION=